MSKQHIKPKEIEDSKKCVKIWNLQNLFYIIMDYLPHNKPNEETIFKVKKKPYQIQ